MKSRYFILALLLSPLVCYAQAPTVTAISPPQGIVGQYLWIQGTNFGSTIGTSTVTVNGVAAGLCEASGASWKATLICVKVPSTTTGNVVVTTTGGSTAGVTFTVLPTPSLTAPNCGLTNDETVHVPGATTWHDFVPPAVGGTYGSGADDSIYGCTVTRLTNAATDNGANGEVQYYATVEPMSAGDTYIMIFDQGGGTDYHIITKTGSVVITVAQFQAAATGQNGAGAVIWDHFVDNVFWITAGNALKKCTVAGVGSVSCVVNHTFSEYAYAIVSLGPPSMGNGGWIPLLGQNVQGSSMDAFMYNPILGVKSPTYTPPSCTSDVNTTSNACVHGLIATAHDGMLAFVVEGAPQGNLIWELPWTGTPLQAQYGSSLADHTDTGFDVNGRSIGVLENIRGLSQVDGNCQYADEPRSMPIPYTLGTSSCMFSGSPSGGAFFNPGWHVSWQGHLSTEYVTYSIQNSSPAQWFNNNASYAAPSAGNWNLYTDEVLYVRSDANNAANLIYRLARAHSRSNEIGGYWGNPKAAQSFDGKYVIFTSTSPYAPSGCGSVAFCSDVFLIGPLFSSSPLFPPSGCAIQGTGPNWSCAAGALFSDMQTAVNNMADGAQLILQNGSYTITSPVSFLLTKGITLICTTAPGAIGAATVNPCNVNVTSPSYGFGVASWPGSGQYFDKLYRISGITFTWSDPPASTVPIEWGSQNAAVNEGTFKYLRFDHNTFTSIYTGTTKDTIKLLATGHRTYFYGAIDHNLETCTDSCHLLLISSAQQDPFVPPNPLGTPNNLFVEDNTVTVTTENNPGEGAFDSDYGLSAVVWRHNTITNDDVTSHFPMINYELYNNLFIKNGGSPNPDCYRAFHSQTNSLSEAFNNQAQCTGTVTSGTVVYSFGSIREAYKADPRTWPTTLECSGFVNHPPFTDVNRLPSQTNQGYPCLWQPTRDPATMALTPYYVWNNIANGVFKSATFGDSFCGQNPNYCPFHIQNNRDIYQALTATPQTSVASCIDGAGVWFGPLTDRPINCPAYTGEVGGGFGYAAHTTSGTIGSSGSGTASDDVLYQFGSGGWKQIYKPYVYPHPLVSGQAQTAAPVFSVAPGPYTSTQNVQVTTTSPSPTLYCTTDRSAPTHPATGTTQTFTGATYPPTFTVSADTEINCLASSDTLLDSLTLSGGYNINAQAYSAWPTQPGSYPAGSLGVQINNPAQLTRQCVTLDGTDPTAPTPGTCGNACSGAGCTLNGVNQFSTVNCTANCTVKFLSTGVGFTNSPITTVQYALGGTNGLWWEDVGSANFAIGGVASAENFGTQAVGVQSGTLPIYLNNIGSTSALSGGGSSTATTTATNVTNVVVAPAGTFALASPSGTCVGTSFSIAAGSYCSLLVTFTPPSNGTFNGTVTITDNAVGSPHVINLTGTGVGGGGQASTPVASPASGAAPLSVTLTTSLGSVICYNTTGAPATNGTTGCTTGTLYTGAISVTVAETLFFVAGGTGLTDSAVGSATYTNPPPAANLTPTTLAFGGQNITTTSAVQNATYTNTGAVTVSVTNVTVAGNFSRATPTTGTPCVGTSFTLAVGASCTIGVTFSPTATIAYNGTLTVNDNSTTSPHVTNLTGQGTQATITWTPTTYNFGNVVLGQSLNSTNLQLKNSGTGPLNVSLTLSDTTHFSIFSNGCPGILAASSTCNVVIQFTPAAVTSYSANLTQTDALASNSPQSVTLSGAGVITPTTPSAPLPVLILEGRGRRR